MPDFVDGNLVIQDLSDNTVTLQEYQSSDGTVVQDTGITGSRYAMAQRSDGKILYCSTRASSTNIGVRILNSDGGDGGTLIAPNELDDLPWFNVRNISIDLDDNIYILGCTGASGGQADFDTTPVDGDKIFVRKFDSLGQYVTHMDFACNKGRGLPLKQPRPLPCTLISPCDSTEVTVEGVCFGDSIGFQEHPSFRVEGAAINREGTIAYFLVARFIYKCVFGESTATIFKDFAEEVLLNPLGNEVVNTSRSPSGGLIVDQNGNVIVNMYGVSTRDWEHRRFTVLELEAAQESVASGNSYVVEFNAVENYMNMPSPSVPATSVSGVDDPEIEDKGWGITASVRVAGTTEVSVLITGAPLGANNPKVVTLTGPAQSVIASAQVTSATATGITVTNNGPGTLTLGTTTSGSPCASGGVDKELGAMSALNNAPQTWSYWTLDQETYDSSGSLTRSRRIMAWAEEDISQSHEPWITTMRWMAINSAREAFFFISNGIPFYTGVAPDGHVELWKDDTQIKEDFLNYWETSMPPLVVVGGNVVPVGGFFFPMVTLIGAT